MVFMLSRRLLPMSRHKFTAAFRGPPMQRAKRRGLARYAALVLGNLGGASDVELLTASLADEEPLVRSHVAWALGSIGTEQAFAALPAREQRQALMARHMNFMQYGGA